MPHKQKKPCAIPGCPHLTYGRYCEEHEKRENRRYEKYNRNPDTNKRYGTNWRKIRKKYVELHPICEHCFEEGIVVPVEEVHHIVPLGEGGNNDFDNLISLCKSCHSKIHASRGDRWHNK